MKLLNFFVHFFAKLNLDETAQLTTSTFAKKGQILFPLTSFQKYYIDSDGKYLLA